MPAYVVSMMSIQDPTTYKKYTDRTPPIVARYGGKFLARGGERSLDVTLPFLAKPKNE